MHRNTELKRLTNTGGLYARPDTAPERRIEQHHVDCRMQNISRQLFEVDDDSVCRQRHADLLTHASHTCHAKHGIFEIVVSNIVDLLAKPDRRFGGPDAIWIETKAIANQRFSQRAITLEFILGRKHSALQLV